MNTLNDRINGLYASAMTRQSGNAGIVFLVCATIMVLFLVFMTSWTDRNLEYILSEMKGRPVEVHGFVSFMFTCLGPIALVFNLVVYCYKA